MVKTGNISLMPLNKVCFSIYRFSGNLFAQPLVRGCSIQNFISNRMQYMEDRANFHLSCKVKYGFHCTHFHETLLGGDLQPRIPLQLVKKYGNYW
jgi:hypothetical protein